MAEAGRWAYRNPEKDRVRQDVWRSLEDTGVAVGPAWDMIPNFVGADMAAWHLAQAPEWASARSIKTNPDAGQIPIRLRALYEGKRVFAPVPYLTENFPYLRLDPERLKRLGVSFELAATAEGFMAHGERIGFEEVDPLDFAVVGSVAVSREGGRTGKGAGFADLETAIFRELGIMRPDTPVATTIHSSQLVGANRLVLESHDSPLDYVATERELIRTGNSDRRPGGVDWERVRPEQFEQIPFLSDLRVRMSGGRP
jgi:5-formyltetrahydrofolate cyclo-ligase